MLLFDNLNVFKYKICLLGTGVKKNLNMFTGWWLQGAPDTGICS